ncbi:hypothetical protein ACF3NG_08620 [Aerococcaceae bacterium WGS1372]
MNLIPFAQMATRIAGQLY